MLKECDNDGDGDGDSDGDGDIESEIFIKKVDTIYIVYLKQKIRL